MQIIENLDDWKHLRANLDNTCRLGFIPTMGNLHEGHCSLIKASKNNKQHPVVSIFINPTQFNNPEDFNHYPRTLDQDLERLREEGVEYCLLPSENALYQDQYRYQIQENQLALLMEGKYRSGHFTGMLTVVMRLLNLVKPYEAYFGEKDYQQYLLIQGMAQAFFLDTQITACPTIREASSLACSSRNNRLSPTERTQAEQFAQVFHQGKSCPTIKKALEKLGIQVEYIEEYANRRFAAVYVGKIRLIDNYVII